MYQSTNQTRLPTLPPCFARLHSANSIVCTGRRGLTLPCDFNQVCRELTQLQKRADALIADAAVIALTGAQIQRQLER